MLFAVQAGFFLGPVIGGALLARGGYSSYFRASVGLALLAGALSLAMARLRATRRQPPPGPA
jgi:predicted MFS family arabinose efflux permease